jgi:phosphoglycolate phosphatase-like HAD superfamily hydrolase
MIKLILYDFDGTLANDIEVILEIEKKLSKDFGVGSFTKAEMKRESKISLLFKHVKCNILKLPSYYHAVQKELELRFKNIDVYPELRGVLHTLSQSGFEQAIVSSNVVHHPVEHIKKWAHEKHLPEFKFVKYASVFFGKSKCLKRIMIDYNLKPEEILYLGDEVSDIKACKKVGIKIVSVNWGFTDSFKLLEYHPDYLISKPKQLLEIIKKLNRN